MAIIVPISHIKRERPTLPVNDRMVLGVAKIPVPMTRLKINEAALTTPIWRRSSGIVSEAFPSSVIRESQTIHGLLTSNFSFQTYKYIINYVSLTHVGDVVYPLTNFDGFGFRYDGRLAASLHCQIGHIGMEFLLYTFG